jgi:DNA-binding response OmpR family regulator
LIRLTNLEFRLLHFLMLNEGKVVDSGLIVERVWGRSNQGDSALLKNVMYRLRRKIEPEPAHPHYLQTLSGEGYLFHATPAKPGK